MKKISLLSFLIIVCLVFGCQSDDNEETPNSPPKDFSITISSISSSKASLSWTKSEDPDGDQVTYAIELDGTKIAQNLTNLTYELEGLDDATTYEVKVIAKDSKGGENLKTKSFTTTNAPMPSDFVVTIETVDYSNATLSWTESTTTENNTVRYSIFLNGENILSNYNDLTYEFISLSPNTEYTGQIIAEADNGQTLVKNFQFITLTNESPASFELVSKEFSFSYILFDFKESIDPENDDLEYQVFLNDEDITDLTFESGILNPNNNYFENNIIRGLDGSTQYQLKIYAKDSFGNTSSSNVVDFTTNTAPPNNFEIEVTYVDDKIRVSWDGLTESIPTNSTFILNNQEYDLDLATIIKNDETGGIVDFDTDVIAPNVDQNLQIAIEWSQDEQKSYSNVVMVKNVVYSDTTVNVNMAKLYNSTSDFFPLQFTITFVDGYISEFEDFEVIEIKFHDTVFENYVFFSQLEWNKGYLNGEITQQDFDYLENFSEGHLITKDESGYHLLNFQYTTEN
ncbi:fibronectin type III domain-containing protein [Flagellimonas sp.]|uniref:fibronectin type III domain-containing protein n=1 Tax=Flagellimonas sp. TaxID=2058762 RepID=UPI003BAB6449